MPYLEGDRETTPDIPDRETLSTEDQNIADHNNNVAGVQSQIHDANALYLKNKNLTETCDFLSKQNEDLIAQKKDLKEANAELSKTLLSHKRISRLFLANYDAQFSKIETENSDLKKKLEQSNTHKAETTIEANKMNRIISKPSEGLAAKVTEISHMGKCSKDFKTLYATGTVLLGLRADIKRKDDHIDSLDVNTRALENKITELDEVVDHNRVQLSWILPIVTQKTLLIEKHEATIKKQACDLKGKARLIASFERDVANRDQTIAVQNSDLDQLIKAFANARTELESKQSDTQQLSGRLIDRGNIIARLRGIIERKNKSINGYENLCLHNDEVIEKLQLRIENLDAELKSWTDRVPSPQAYQDLKEMNEMNECVIKGRDNAIQCLEEELDAQKEMVKKLWQQCQAHMSEKEETEVVGWWDEEETNVEESKEDGDFVFVDNEESETKSVVDTDEYGLLGVEGDFEPEIFVSDGIESKENHHGWDTMMGVEDQTVQW